MADMKTEKTLHEYKKKTQECVKQQTDTKRVIVKDGVLKVGEAAECIRSRRLKKIEQA